MIFREMCQEVFVVSIAVVMVATVAPNAPSDRRGVRKGPLSDSRRQCSRRESGISFPPHTKPPWHLVVLHWKLSARSFAKRKTKGIWTRSLVPQSTVWHSKQKRRGFVVNFWEWCSSLFCRRRVPSTSYFTTRCKGTTTDIWLRFWREQLK